MKRSPPPTGRTTMPRNSSETATKFFRELGCTTPFSAQTKLAYLRRHGKGPVYRRTGSGLTCQVMYEDDDVLAWIRSIRNQG